VRQSSEATGDKPVVKYFVVTTELATSIMAKGNAWNTDVIAEREKVVLEYFVNEACVNSITFFIEIQNSPFTKSAKHVIRNGRRERRISWRNP
jgi:hypothetical protein